MVTDGQEQFSLERPLSDPDDVRIGFVGGASRLWARNLVNDLAGTPELGGEVLLYDLDYEGASRNAEFGNWVQDREDVESDWRYRAVEDRAEALAGADFVVCSTQYPTTDAFRHDLEIPREYGIYGAVSATIGPGGLFRAMRTIPVYRDIARAVEEHCPDAWVFNYTNPVTFVTRALYAAYPDINAIGLCHEVLHFREWLAGLVEEYLDADASREEIDVELGGINHFTWVTEARWRGRDLLPLVDHHLERDGVVREFEPAELDGESGFVDNYQVTYELYRRFGVLPAAGDRHLVEYATWFLQGEMPESMRQWGIKRTTADYRVSRWEDEPDRIGEWLSGEREYELDDTGEVFTDLMAALLGLGTFESNVNLPNRGQMTDVEEGAIVETQARVRANDVRPLVSGSLPRPVRNLVNYHVNNQETLMEAALDDYDVDLAFQAFLNDPQVTSLQTTEAVNLFGELFDAERQFLDDWDVEGSAVLAEAETFPG